MRWWRRHLVELAILIATLGLALWATPAFGAFPYTRSGGDPHDYTTLHLSGQVPNDLGGDGNTFKFAATPDPANALDNADPVELGGVRGAHLVDGQASQATSCDNDPPTTPTSASVRPTAFQLTLGRPDVTIAVLDSGIKWNDDEAMDDLRDKVHLNRGELPKPQADLATAISAPSANDCATFDTSSYDANGDRVFNIEDYACDGRVAAVVGGDSRRVGPSGVLTPQDLIIAFSKGTDDDGNGYIDDIAGWDFLDDDNDPFDDVQYGHGTGEAKDSSAEATLSIPSTSCSSNATGLGAGMAGLVYSAALDARANGVLPAYPDRSQCVRVDSTPCLVTPNEVRQIMASGTIRGIPRADDVDFAGVKPTPSTPPDPGTEPSCSPAPTAGCTDPNGALQDQVDTNRQPAGFPATRSYPARWGHDQFYGWGRANMRRALHALLSDRESPVVSRVPPEAEITSPEWFAQVDPSRPSVQIDG